MHKPKLIISVRAHALAQQQQKKGFQTIMKDSIGEKF